jgi:putative DNA primase/helicase
VLDAAIQQMRALAVIISPLSAYLGSKDSYKDAEIRGLLTPLAALADQRQVAMVGVMHLTKAQQARLLNRVQGSVAFVGQARTVLVVGEDGNAPGRRLLASVKNNLGPLAPALAFRISDSGLIWEPTPVEGPADVLLAGDEMESRSARREREQAARFLRELLADGFVPSKQVMADAKANGIAQRTLWRAKADLGVLAERSKGDTKSPWYWWLPQPEPGA